MSNLIYMYDKTTIAESICKKYIEEELGLFFKSCKKAAYVFSAMISKDPSNYSKATFEDMVVSPDEISELITRIDERISFELGIVDDAKEMQYRTDGFDDLEFRNEMIDRQINEYRMTNRITKISENIITGSVSLILGDAFSSNILDYFFSKAKIAERLLENNNHDFQAERFQKEIYSHIEGALINIKTKLKDELTMKWLRYIDESNTGISAVV